MIIMSLNLVLLLVTYKEKFGEKALSISNNFYDSEISIPCHQKMNMEDAKYVADTIISIINKHSINIVKN